MTGTSRLTGLACIAVSLGFAAAAVASPTGTPPANRPPTGTGHSLGGLFDDVVGSRHDAQTGEASDDRQGGDSGKRHRHLTAAEWRAAYIAKHGHDLPSLAHPGH